MFDPPMALKIKVFNKISNIDFLNTFKQCLFQRKTIA